MVTSNILSTLAAMGLTALRERLILARVANREYESAMVGQTKGATINVTIPSAIAATDVVPSQVPPATTDTTPTSVPVTLSQWKEAAFFLSDKDLAQVQAGIIPTEASEAIKAIGNAIEDFLWSIATFPYFTGTAGVTPFGSSIDDYLDARNVANKALMPDSPRAMILSPDAEAQALGLAQVTAADKRGNADPLIRGQIGEILGAVWGMSQRVPVQSPGTTNGAYAVNGAHAAGVKQVTVQTGTGTLLKGSIITFAGFTQTYALQATHAGGAGVISIEPALQLALSGGELITSKAAFTKNLLLHRDGLTFAMAPLTDNEIAPNLIASQSIVDEISGLALRVEVTREHKRWRWSYDALYGGSMIRPEFGVILAG